MRSRLNADMLSLKKHTTGLRKKQEEQNTKPSSQSKEHSILDVSELKSTLKARYQVIHRVKMRTEMYL